jgi:putative cell wall-binding protein
MPFRSARLRAAGLLPLAAVLAVGLLAAPAGASDRTTATRASLRHQNADAPAAGLLQKKLAAALASGEIPAPKGARAQRPGAAALTSADLQPHQSVTTPPKPGPPVFLDVNNNAGGDSVMADRDAGSDVVVNRGGSSWLAPVPKSGHGLRSLASVGSDSVVWRTDGMVYRGNPNIADPTLAANSHAIPADAGLWGNTGDGWLLGEGFTVSGDDRFGGKFVHMAWDGTIVHEYPNGPDVNDDLNPPHMAIGYSIADDNGMLYVRSDAASHVGDVHYINFATHANTILYTTGAGEDIGQMVSMTPTYLSFFEIDAANHKAVVHRVLRSTAESTKTTDTFTLDYTTDSSAYQVVVSDNGVAWTSLKWVNNVPHLGGLHWTMDANTPTITDHTIPLPPSMGQLMARRNDFVYVGNDETTAADVRHFAPTDTVATLFAGLPAPVSADVRRSAGASLYDTSAEISHDNFSPGVSHAYIATGLNFPDALAGAPVAAKNSSPILLVPGTSIPTAIATELTRLHPAQITILGGPGSVSSGVATALHHYTTGSVTRLYGADRYSGAAAMSRATFNPGVDSAFLVTGTFFSDALAGAPAAATLHSPILLTGTWSMPDSVKAELARLKPKKIYVLGGGHAVSSQVAAVAGAFTSPTKNQVVRVWGLSLYDTAAQIGTYFFHPGAAPVGGYSPFIATGTNFPDALGAAPVAGMLKNPILLVPLTGIPDSIGTTLDSLSPTSMVIVGGTGVVPLAIQQDLGTYIQP